MFAQPPRDPLDYYEPPPPINAPPSRRPPTHGELEDARWELAQGDRGQAALQDLSRDYQPILDALGLPQTENPALWQSESMQRPGRLSGEARAGFFGWRRLNQEMAILNAIRARRTREPNFLPGVPDDYEGFRAWRQQQAHGRRAAARDTIERNEGAMGPIEGFGRDMGTLMVDPVSIGSVLVPIGAGASIASTMGRAAIVNGFIELFAGQPIVAANRERYGEELTVGESALMVGGAAIGGGLLVGGGAALARSPVGRAMGALAGTVSDAALERLFRALPEDLQQRWLAASNLDDELLLSILRNAVPEQRWNEDIRAAVRVLQRDIDVARASPFEEGAAGAEIHARMLDESMARLGTDDWAPAPRLSDIWRERLDDATRGAPVLPAGVLERRAGAAQRYATREEAIGVAIRELQGRGLDVGENVQTGRYNPNAHTYREHGRFAADVNVGRGNEEAANPAMRAQLDQVALEYQARGYRILWNRRIYEPFGNGPGAPIPARNRRGQSISPHTNHLHIEAGEVLVGGGPARAQAGRTAPAGSRGTEPTGAEGERIFRERMPGHESGGRYVRNRTGSSAYGPFQFTGGTFRGYHREAFPDSRGWSDAQIDARVNDPAVQEAVLGAAIRDYRQRLNAAGLPDTPTNLYMLHHFGPDGVRVLQADPATPLSRILNNWDQIDRQNPHLNAATTAGDIIAELRGRMGQERAAPPAPVERTDGSDPFAAEAAGLERLRTENELAAARADMETPRLRRDLFDTDEAHERAQVGFQGVDERPLDLLLRNWDFAREAGRQPAPMWAVRERDSGELVTWSASKREAERAMSRQWEPDELELVRLRPEQADNLRAAAAERAARKQAAGAATAPPARETDPPGLTEPPARESAQGGAAVPASAPLSPAVIRTAQEVGAPSLGSAVAARVGTPRWAPAEALTPEMRAAGIERAVPAAELRAIEREWADDVWRRAADEWDPPEAAALARFDEPGGDGMAATVKSMEHDLRAELARLGDGEQGPAYRLGEEGDEVSLRAVADQIDRDRAAAAAVRGCLA